MLGKIRASSWSTQVLKLSNYFCRLCFDCSHGFVVIVKLEIMNAQVLFVTINVAKDMIFDDSDNEDVEEVAMVPKVKNFAEQTVPQFAGHHFRQHFRVSIETFEKLLTYLIQIKNSENRRPDGRQELNLEKQLMICIWYLSNLESLR